MTLYCVRCYAADGRTHDAYVRANSENGATREALRTLPDSEGWRAGWVLEQ